jgi:hypothetical protein
MKRPRCLAVAALAAVCSASAVALAPDEAAAFCGFYVGGADTGLYNDATMVVLMRDGTRTVLSMQNNYQGPPQDFALVVPVPVILKAADVKTLPAEVFARVDQLAAPRLVEYWEQDPCYVPPRYDEMEAMSPVEDSEDPLVKRRSREPRDLGVTIEAKFAVGEYQILILGAKDSTGLDLWLRQSGYKIPAGADAVLRPYVAAGMKFFVAKVDIDKVRKDAQGRTMLSPLRFHYDSEAFSLPVRLGLMNSQGQQDLIVHVLARATRYELANYRNVAIPTNLEVTEATRADFGGFYAALFDRTLAGSGAAVVTEYAWSAGSCDPCPQEPLTLAELTTLGADVLPSYAHALGRERVPSEMQYQVPSEFVLTRLHARYGRENLGEDLVFQAAPAIEGGREVETSAGLEQGARPAQYGANSFQARYIIRHPWTGPITCESPKRGVWGGPPDGALPPAQAARDLAFVRRDAPLTEFLREEVPAGLGALPSGPVTPPPVEPYQISGDARGCGRCDVSGGPGSLVALICGALLGLLRRRQPHGGAR